MIRVVCLVLATRSKLARTKLKLCRPRMMVVRTYRWVNRRPLRLVLTWVLVRLLRVVSLLIWILIRRLVVLHARVLNKWLISKVLVRCNG